MSPNSRSVVLPFVVSSLLGSTAFADTFGGWRYTPPPDYAIEKSPDHVALTKRSGASFCSISLFEVRYLERSLAIEQAYDWHNVVTHTFAATIKRRGTLQTKDGTISAITATLVDGDRERYAGTHYVVTPPGMIGSVLVIAPTLAELTDCARDAAGFVRSLDIDWSSPLLTDAEARVETPQGRWAITGPTSREYTFAADGTYRFHSETTSQPVRVVHEVGTYKLIGNQLTLTPRNATLATVADGVGKLTAAPLEKTTYTWRKRYLPGTNEWRMIMTPRKATARDGKLPAGAAGYQYSELEKPAWQFPPAQPGV